MTITVGYPLANALASGSVTSQPVVPVGANISDAGSIPVMAKSTPLTGKSVLSAAGIGFYQVGTAGTYIPFGDSRVAYGTNDGTYSNVSLARGQWTQLEAALGGRLRCLRNAGVSGNTTTQMRERLQSDVIAYSPGWCFLLGPLNDIVLGFDLETVTKPNMRAMYAACKLADIRFATSTITPCSLIDQPSEKKAHSDYNNWVRAWAADNCIPLADDFAYTADPVTGQPVTNTMFDNIHFADLGASYSARAWFNVLDPLIPNANTLQSMYLDYDNLLWGDSGNWIAGALPSGWAAYTTNAGTPTNSCVARTDGIQGAVLSTVGTAVAQGGYIGLQGPLHSVGGTRPNANLVALNARILASDGNQYICTTSGLTGASAPAWVPAIGATTTDNLCTWTRVNNFLGGDLCYAEVEYFVENVSGGLGGFQAQAIFQAQGSNPSEVRICVSQDSATRCPPPFAANGVLRSRPFVLTGTTTGYVPFVFARMDNGVTGTLKIGRMAIKHFIAP